MRASAEVDRLWQRYKRIKSNELRNELVERYFLIVHFVADRISATLPAFVDRDDLRSCGSIGLMEAVERFDPNRGIKFETYCMNRVRGAILDYLREVDWVPRLVRVQSGMVKEAKERLKAELGREPTFVEISRALGLSLTETAKVLRGGRVVHMVSLAEEWGSLGDAISTAEVLVDEKAEDPFVEVSREDFKEFLKKLLSKKERAIIALYYYEGLTMKEIADFLLLNESRVSQIHSKVIGRLKNKLRQAEV